MQGPRPRRRGLLRFAAAQDCVAALWGEAPSCPGSFGADARAQLFSKYSRLALPEACPGGKPAPRRPDLSEDTWVAVRTNSKLKARAFRDGRLILRSYLRLRFQYWVTGLSDGLRVDLRQQLRHAARHSAELRETEVRRAEPTASHHRCRARPLQHPPAARQSRTPGLASPTRVCKSGSCE